MVKNIVIGVGNLLFCDDGVGVLAAIYLEKNFTFKPELEILDGGTLGFNLIDYFLHYDNVLILDTVSIDDEAGSIYKIPSDELLGGDGYKKTAHEVEVVEMLQASQLYEEQAKVTVFGIVPQDIYSTQIGLSKSLNLNFDMLIQTVVKAVEEIHIEVVKKGNVTLKDIVKELKGV